MNAKMMMVAGVLGAGLLAGCGDDGGTQPGGTGGGGAGGGGGEAVFPVEGTIEGDVPEGAQAAIVWYLEDGNAYKKGEATISGSTFSFDAGATPPGEGLIVNEDGRKLGAAWVVLFPSAVPDGPIRFETSPPIGLTARHAVVYREGDVGGEFEQLPEAEMTCAQCVDGENNVDSYASTSCTGLVLHAGDLSSVDSCNIF